MTRQEIHEAAVRIVARSTAAQGLSFHVTDEAALDQLAGAVVEAHMHAEPPSTRLRVAAQLLAARHEAEHLDDPAPAA